MTTPAYNCVFGFPIRSDISVSYTAVRSGGSWQSANPLTNLQDARIKKVARSTDATTASTQWETDMAVARAIRVLGILGPNATAAATVRWRASSVSGDYSSPIYDSGAVLILPSGQTAEQLYRLNVWKTLVASADQTARYWKTEINDTANPDGYVDVGREVICSAYQTSINMAYNASIGLLDRTTVDETDGNAEIFNVRPTRRVAKFTVEDIPEDEAMGSAFDMQRILGVAGQVHFVFDPTDTTHMHRRAFLGRLRSLSPIEFPFYKSNHTPYEVSEVL